MHESPVPILEIDVFPFTELVPERRTLLRLRIELRSGGLTYDVHEGSPGATDDEIDLKQMCPLR